MCGFIRILLTKKLLKKHLLRIDKKQQKTFRIEESERYFKKDENGEPNEFDFTIETVGIWRPEAVLKEACDILIRKLMTFRDNLVIDYC